MSTQQLQELRPLMDASREKMVGELDQVRQGFEEMLTQFGPAPGVTFKEAQIGSVPGTWVTPSSAVDGRVLLYLHGGGYAIGSSKAYGPLASELASRLKGRVLVPDYRLAPEHPYPAALEDAVSAYRWLLDQGTPAGSIAVAGDSCGGGLTVATLVAIRDAGLPLPVGAVLISAWADLSVTSDSITSKAGEDFVLNADMLRGHGWRLSGVHSAENAGRLTCLCESEGPAAAADSGWRDGDSARRFNAPRSQCRRRGS